MSVLAIVCKRKVRVSKKREIRYLAVAIIFVISNKSAFVLRMNRNKFKKYHFGLENILKFKLHRNKRISQFTRIITREFNAKEIYKFCRDVNKSVSVTPSVPMRCNTIIT